MLFIFAPKFAYVLSLISFGTTVMPRSNWNQWLCKALGDKQGVLSSRWRWRIFIKNWSSSPSTPLYKTSLLLILFGNWALPNTACQWLNEREKGWGCWRGVDHTHSSLPADVLWGSFVTHSFLHPKGRLWGGYTHYPLPGRGVGKGVSVGE